MVHEFCNRWLSRYLDTPFIKGVLRKKTVNRPKAALCRRQQSRHLRCQSWRSVVTPSSVENPPFAMLSRIVGPVAGVSPAAARGAATSTSRLCFRSATMLFDDDQDQWRCSYVVHPRAGVLCTIPSCDASWLYLCGYPASRTRSSLTK